MPRSARNPGVEKTEAEEFAQRCESMTRMDTVQAVADAGGQVSWATGDTDGQNMRLLEHI